jgi:hypothetical protein
MRNLRRCVLLPVITLLVLALTPPALQAQSVPRGTGIVHAGEVFHDGNVNGVREISERELYGIVVTLETLEGAILQTVASDGDGYYLFTDLPAGQFRVRVRPPQGYSVTRNGAYTIDTRAPQATVIPSTGLFLGLFLPAIQR